MPYLRGMVALISEVSPWRSMSEMNSEEMNSEISKGIFKMISEVALPRFRNISQILKMMFHEEIFCKQCHR